MSGFYPRSMRLVSYHHRENHAGLTAAALRMAFDPSQQARRVGLLPHLTCRSSGGLPLVSCFKRTPPSLPVAGQRAGAPEL